MATIPPEEKIIFSVPIDDFEKDRYILFTTRKGLTKRTHIRDLIATRYSKALKATKVRDGDEVVSVDICTGENSEVLLVTKDGYALKYNSTEISLFAPASFGVKAIELKNRPDDEIVGSYFVNPKDTLLILSDKGTVRRFKSTDVPKGRKIHVGRILVDVNAKHGHLIDFEVLHDTNPDSKCFLVGESTSKQLNMDEDVKGINIKKLPILTPKVGNPVMLIGTRKSEDFQ